MAKHQGRIRWTCLRTFRSEVASDESSAGEERAEGTTPASGCQAPDSIWGIVRLRTFGQKLSGA
jgi:hypothetical protein